MKDINKLKDYRLKYKRYYEIDFDSSFAIHHIDFNHNNNDINNLLLLPKKLHTKYHYYLIALGHPDGKISIDFKICYSLFNYNFDLFNGFLQTLEEIRKWFDYKKQLDYKKMLKESLK